MEKPSLNSRSLLISLIVILLVVQIAILVYLAVYLWPRMSEIASVETTVTPQSQLPLQDTPIPGNTSSAPSTSNLTELEAGPPIEASNYVDRARMFDVEQAFTHIVYLSGEEAEGRQPGTPGAENAGNYIAELMSEYGLQPAGDDDTFFQSFGVPYGRVTETPLLEITPPAGEIITSTYSYGTDYRAVLSGYLGPGAGEGQVVWLSECQSDDYLGQDVLGKIVLCRYDGDDVELYRQAIEHRVGGLLLLPREAVQPPYYLRSYRETLWVPEPIPAFLISDRVAEDILAGSGYTLDELSLRFDPLALPSSVSMEVIAEEQAEVQAQNVLGLLPGSDPDFDDEYVVVGAHYDHIGSDPEGVLMPGANDNASGVSFVLEIARLWHEQDYRPARNVVFAAWDGEEQGLLGARHYVMNPTYPLTQTVYMVNFDMVGTNAPVNIDGEGPVAAQLLASAETFGITTTTRMDGRSDHIPFTESGVPAAMYIRWPDTNYHLPRDNPESLSLDHMRVLGAASAHTLSALAQVSTELEQAVERMWIAIASGDRDSFVAGIDPRDPDLQTSQAAWFDNLWSRELSEIVMEPVEIRVGDNEATVSLRLSYRWVDAAGGPPTIYDVRFVQRAGVWYLGGYDLETLEGDVVTVSRFEDVPFEPSLLLSTTQQTYLAITSDLEIEPITGTRFIYYPNFGTLRAVARPAADRDTRWLAQSAGLAEIGWGQVITAPIANLVLNQMGLPPDAAPWLREGLSAYYRTQEAGAYLAELASDDTSTITLDLPDLSLLPSAQADALRAQAWSATSYLLEQYGRTGLQQLCAIWGETDDEDAAFAQALGVSRLQFESSWRTSIVEPLRADLAAIQAVLDTRAEAVMAGDVDAFLATTVRDDAVLRTEERNWFAALDENPVTLIELTAEIVEWEPDDAQAVVVIGSDFATGGRNHRADYNALFVRQGGEWLYAGMDWEIASSPHFILKYQEQDAEWAERFLELAEEVYTQVTSDLEAVPVLPQEIKIFDDADVFQTSISPATPNANGWSLPGEAIRLLITQDDTRIMQELVAHELAHKVLFNMGLETAWLHEGIAAYETGRVFALGTHWQAGQLLEVVRDAVSRQSAFLPEELPISYQDIPEDSMELVYAQSWSLVNHIAENRGLNGVRQLVSRSITSDNTAANLGAVLGSSPDAVWDDWRDSIYSGNVPEELVDLAQSFDAQLASEHIATLSGPEYGGREAGTAGADLAATYIAERFRELGLQPLGDVITSSGESSYLQQFSINYTGLTSTPILSLFDSDGDLLYDFSYREDFIESSGQGSSVGELVFSHAENLGRLYFGGAIVIEEDVDDPLARATQLGARGAGGLIVVTDMESDDLQTGYIRASADTTDGIPVVQITEAAFLEFLNLVGLEERDLSFAPPTLPLGVQAQIDILRTPLTETFASNVIGLLPGSVPDLADEVLIIGANYDHIGQSPNGFYFPGANRNASGISVMLEMARVWRAEGYRPSRSVLFVAWGSEELAVSEGAQNPGVIHYLNDPAIPLEQTVGVISLDSIGAGDGYRLLFYGVRERDLPLIWQVEAGATSLGRQVWRRGSTGEGWHGQFGALNIPSIKFIWDRAEEDFYLPTDDIDFIDVDNLASSGEVITLLSSWLTSR